VPPRFGSSSATAGAAIDIALTKTATAADFPIGCLKLDLPVPGRSGFATPVAGAHFSHVSRPSPSLRQDDEQYQSDLQLVVASVLFVEPDRCEISIDEWVGTICGGSGFLDSGIS
jgi:hypothetical protein